MASTSIDSVISLHALDQSHNLQAGAGNKLVGLLEGADDGDGEISVEELEADREQSIDQEMGVAELAVGLLTGEATSLEVRIGETGEALDRVLIKQGYVSYFDPELKAPRVVGYQISGEDLSRAKVKRVDNFQPDPALTGESGSPSLEDYSGSGYDRGHQFPTADAATRAIADEGFLLTNMTPQTEELNRGVWKQLEADVRQMVEDDAGVATVFTGGLYLEDGPKALDLDAGGNCVAPPAWAIGEAPLTKPGGIPVPSHSFKVLLVQPPEGDASAVEAFAWVATNSETPVLQEVSVDALEELTGLEFFSFLDEETQARIEGEKANPVYAYVGTDRPVPDGDEG